MLKGLAGGVLAGILLFTGCSKKDEDGGGGTTPPVKDPVFDINKLDDTYESLAPFNLHELWGPYNVHDPSIKKYGDYYYCYSTDVGFGIDVPPGIQIRKSKDLVDWKFVGWAFSGLPANGAAFIRQHGGTPFNSLWAPCLTRSGNEYRLYYSLSSGDPTARLSVIGLATASSPEGPWTEKDVVVSSLNNAAIQTNAIDPTILITPAGEHWMYYGSAWDGIYILKLNPETGMASTPGDIGKRISQRGFTGNTINGNVEGAEIIYNTSLNKYFLFIAYDWLSTKYNVRVGRADTPEGPFLDFNGHDLNLEEDHGSMIIAPYKFQGHGGWQGTSHCTVFENNNQFFIAHQGRPGVNSFFMDLHVRKLYWTKDGWPVASPERYAATEQTTLNEDEIAGEWEKIVLGYTVVPGYANEQTSPDFQLSQNLTLGNDGTVNGSPDVTWTWRSPWLSFHDSTSPTDSVYVEKGRDWENKKPTLIFTGLNSVGTAVWGKKK